MSEHRSASEATLPRRWLNRLLDKLGPSKPPSYAELLEEKRRLKSAVLFWRYADGTLVPVEKRGRLMRDLARLEKRIKYHPDNPDNG